MLLILLALAACGTTGSSPASHDCTRAGYWKGLKPRQTYREALFSVFFDETGAYRSPRHMIVHQRLRGLERYCYQHRVE